MRTIFCLFAAVVTFAPSNVHPQLYLTFDTYSHQKPSGPAESMNDAEASSTSTTVVLSYSSLDHGLSLKLGFYGNVLRSKGS